MKESRFTEEQIAFALRQAETGTKVSEVCRKMGVAEATFYNWKKNYGGLGVSELRHMKQLKVSKSTLIEWFKVFELEIRDLRNIELEALRKEFMLNKEKKLEIIKEIFNKLIENLRSRNYDIPSDKLINIVISLLDRLENSNEIAFVAEEDIVKLDFSDTKTWYG
jgi:putative transposase